MEIPHDPNDVGSKVDGDMIEQGRQKVPLKSDWVSAMDGMEAHRYYMVDDTYLGCKLLVINVSINYVGYYITSTANPPSLIDD